MSRLTALSERDAGFIEGFAAACDALMRKLTGDSPSAKSYDPMTVDLEDGIMRSYAFDLKDGGRQHPISDYASKAEICALILDDSASWIGKLA